MVNEKSEKFHFQENVSVYKTQDKEIFKEKSKKHIYKINDSCIVEKFVYKNTINSQTKSNDCDIVCNQPDDLRDSIKQQFNELIEIVNQSPKTYRELSQLIDNFQNDEAIEIF